MMEISHVFVIDHPVRMSVTVKISDDPRAYGALAEMSKIATARKRLS